MRTLCFGDSNTYGYDPRSFFGGRYPVEQRWVNILSGMTGWETINAGENGRKIPQREGEIRRLLDLLEVEKPDYLIVVLGSNDLLQGATPETAAQRMEALLRRVLQTEKTKILLVGPPPKERGEWVPSEELVHASEELAIQYRQVAEKLRIGFADAGEWNVSVCFDGVHYTEAGHRAFAEGIYQAIMQLEDQDGMENVLQFYEQKDEHGITNLEKIARYQKVIRRIATTDPNRSYEEGENQADSLYPSGMVVEGGRLIGFGIHIFNEDIYPRKSFEIYLRNCDLTGTLDLSECRDLMFVDVYHNRISAVVLHDNSALRILGIQDNQITALDPTGLISCQGIDAGKNRLMSLDVSRNQELVELYINDNDISEIDLSMNPKLKYFYCHNNRISTLDTTSNPFLRHLDATGNPMKTIRSLAPQREEQLPLELYAGEGGCVGLKFNPVYNAQWKETGEWQQTCFAYPDDGWRFTGWYDETGLLVNDQTAWQDVYGTSRRLTARFSRE